MTKGLPIDNLRPLTRKWVLDYRRSYILEQHTDRLLVMAASTYDRWEQAREVLDREGPVYLDALGQPKPRPEVAIERDTRIAFARLIREADYEGEGPTEVKSQPPLLRSNRRLRAVT
jgi:hypothetical protein